MGTVDSFSEEVIAIIKMFVIILACLFAAANSLPFQFSSFSKPSVRVPNPCTTTGKDMAWCSTNTTSAGEHVEGNYGYCPSTCPGAENNTTTTTASTTTSTTTSSTTTTVSTTTPLTTTTTTAPTTTTASTTTSAS